MRIRPAETEEEEVKYKYREGMRKIKMEEENKKTHKRKAFHTSACHLSASTLLDAIISCLILNRLYD